MVWGLDVDPKAIIKPNVQLYPLFYVFQTLKSYLSINCVTMVHGEISHRDPPRGHRLGICIHKQSHVPL